MGIKTTASKTMRITAGWLAPVALLLLAGCAESPSSRREVSNILLVTMDTLRADHLSAWGYTRPTSPTIDALAAEGVRFDQAWAQWPKTGPSFASLFTSTYPKDNRIVRRVGKPLPAGFLMLAETLQRRGYSTHAVVSNGAVGSDYYFDQGFDTYVETWKLPLPGDGTANTAEAVNREVRKILDGLHAAQPYFLWVHYIDPHFPYEPPWEFLQPFLEDDVYEPLEQIHVAENAHRRQMGGIGLGQLLDDRRDLGYYVAAYDAEIAYADHQLGLLLDEMKSRGLMEHTLTVFTSDHGESLGEHRYFFDHGRFGFETCLHVPLVFHYPGHLEPRVDPDPVELLDVTPTIMQFAGISVPGGEWMQGRSLMPRLAGEAGEVDRFVHAEAGYATLGRWQKIVRNRTHKLLFVPYSVPQRHVAGRRQPFALYDLVNDPGETENLVASEPEIFQQLKDEMWAWWVPESFDVMADVGDIRDDKEVSEETLENLRALGYID